MAHLPKLGRHLVAWCSTWHIALLLLLDRYDLPIQDLPSDVIRIGKLNVFLSNGSNE